MEADPQTVKSIDFFCGSCGGPITCSSDKAGGQVDCPQCKAANEVPGSAAEDKNISKATEQAEIFKFFCVCCGQKLSSPVEFAGKNFDCPNCAYTNVVPGEPKAKPPAPVTEDLIRFFCNGCGQKLSCGPELTGQTIDCPVCSAATRVPAPSAPTTGGAPAKPVPVRPPKPMSKVVPPPAKLEKPKPAAETEPAPKAEKEPAPELAKLPVPKVPKPVPLQRPTPPTKPEPVPEVPEPRSTPEQPLTEKREEPQPPGEARRKDAEAASLPESKLVVKGPAPMRKPEPSLPAKAESVSRRPVEEEQAGRAPEEPRREPAAKTSPAPEEQRPEPARQETRESEGASEAKPAGEKTPKTSVSPSGAAVRSASTPATPAAAVPDTEKKEAAQTDAPQAPAKAAEKPQGVSSADLPPVVTPQPEVAKPASTTGEKTARKPKGVPSIDFPPVDLQLPTVEAAKPAPETKAKRTAKPKGVPKIDLPPSEPRLPAAPGGRTAKPAAPPEKEGRGGQPELQLEVKADAPTRERRPLVAREITLHREEREPGDSVPSAEGAASAPADPQAELPLVGEKNPDQKYGKAGVPTGGVNEPSRKMKRPVQGTGVTGSTAEGAPQQPAEARGNQPASVPGKGAGPAAGPPRQDSPARMNEAVGNIPAKPKPGAPVTPPAKKKSRLARMFGKATRNMIPGGSRDPQVEEGPKTESAAVRPGKPASLPSARKGSPPAPLADPGAGNPIQLRPRNAPTGAKPEAVGGAQESKAAGPKPAASQPIRVNRPKTGKKGQRKVAKHRPRHDQPEEQAKPSDETAAQNTEKLRKRTVLPPRKNGPVSREVRGPGKSGAQPGSAD
jgi:hypothetical protein